MTHSEACRKRFDEIEKKKLDKQLEEDAEKFLNLRQKTVNEMDVEQSKHRSNL